MRKKIIAGNWKMNPNAQDAEQLWNGINKHQFKEVEVIVAPPSIYLSQWAPQQEVVALSAQNVHSEPKGAFTGEIAPEMLQSLKIPYSIVGHSERRTIFKESDALIAEKVKGLLRAHIQVILCCGEPLDIRTNQEHIDYVIRQLQNSLKGVEGNEMENIIIAYEPVWAIGTDETASTEQAQEMHAAIRKYLKDEYGSIGKNISILYGGSCKPSNAQSLFEQEDIDGGLIGGASLKLNDFLKIIEALK